MTDTRPYHEGYEQWQRAQDVDITQPVVPRAATGPTREEIARTLFFLDKHDDWKGAPDSEIELSWEAGKHSVLRALYWRSADAILTLFQPVVADNARLFRALVVEADAVADLRAERAARTKECVEFVTAAREVIVNAQRELVSERDRRVAAQESITEYWQPRVEALEAQLAAGTRELEAARGAREFLGHDHPMAKGRKPERGESEWRFLFTLDDGSTLVVKVGRRGREAFLRMLAEEAADDAIDAAIAPTKEPGDGR